MGSTRKSALVGVLALAASLVAAAPASTHGGVSVRCTFHMLDPAGVYRPVGTYSGGSVKCSLPLGKGTYSGAYRDKLVHYPVAAETGSSILSLRGGTVRGAYRISGPYTNYHYQGQMHFVGGTGRFRHASGTLKLKCVKRLPDMVCTGSGTVKGI
jgi:hypothetical protein